MKGIIRIRSALVSLIFLGVISTAAVLAPWVTHYSYEEQNISEKLQAPSLTHWMGTDSLGRDLYSRIVYGARMSLSVGVVTAVIALLLGTLLGGLAGYYGKWIDEWVMRTADFLSIFPTVLMAILLMLLFGRGFLGILIALAITSWVTQARLVRAQVLQARELPYVESAKALGIGDLRILFRHILPNLWGPIVVSLTAQIPNNIMAESFLSFVGLGLQPPFSSWGTLANEGFRAMESYPYLMIFPGTVLFITLWALNTLGDGIETTISHRSKTGLMT